MTDRGSITNDSMIKDAQEFGLHIRQGGWRLGMLVARNVERSKPGSKIASHDAILQKVSAREFARQAGTGDHRVTRYLDAWEDAANDGHVPPASTLTPGEEVDLDVDRLPSWGYYYAPVIHGIRLDPRAHAAVTDRPAIEHDDGPDDGPDDGFPFDAYRPSTIARGRAGLASLDSLPVTEWEAGVIDDHDHVYICDICGRPMYGNDKEGSSK